MLKNSPEFQMRVQPAFKKPISMLTSTLMTRGFILAASLGALLWSHGVAAETFYKWVDKDGSTHYTQTPPGKNGVRSAKKVYIDDLAPPTPVATTNSENRDGNLTSTMDANQLANAANNGSIPNSNGQQIPQTVTVPQSQPQQVITPITPPPANRLIVPAQDQVRPVFSEQ